MRKWQSNWDNIYKAHAKNTKEDAPCRQCKTRLKKSDMHNIQYIIFNDRVLNVYICKSCEIERNKRHLENVRNKAEKFRRVKLKRGRIPFDKVACYRCGRLFRKTELVNCGYKYPNDKKYRCLECNKKATGKKI